MIPPQSLEAVLQLLADGQSTYINQTANAEEVRRLLNPPMCYLDDFGIKQVHDAPSTTTSTSGASTTTTTLPPEPLSNSASFPP